MEVTRLYHGSVIPNKQIEGIFGINPDLDVNLSSSEILAEGAGIMNAGQNGVAVAYLYLLEVPTILVTHNSTMISHGLASFSPRFAGIEELGEVENFGSNVVVEPRLVPDRYKKTRYVQFYEAVAKPFFFTWIPPEFVLGVQKIMAISGAIK
ncbi:hypothetical protein KBC89_03975 [Candidatus Woesebacteria bacterium]|nr:hypothetical protein [Candidatus Woesebacteria bacterium]